MCRAAIDISLLWSERRDNLRCGIHRGGEVSSPSGLGNPTPTGSRVCDNTTLRSSGARGLDVSRCYRHIAPLERKAGQFAARSIVGAPRPAGWGTQPLRGCFPFNPFNPRQRAHVALKIGCVVRVGEPNPYAQRVSTGSTVCDNTTLRSSGVRGLDVSRCYRHIAPLERKAGQFAVRYPLWGRGSPRPAGWGTQPLRIPRSRFPCVVAPLR